MNILEEKLVIKKTFHQLPIAKVPECVLIM